MAEYIDREKLVRQIICSMAEFIGAPDDVQRHDEQCNYAINMIEDAPAADIVPVVRCKDCKYAYYYNEEGCRGFVCNGYFQYADIESNDFCSYGEMRNNYE